MNNFASDKQRKFVYANQNKPMQVEKLLRKIFETSQVEYNGRSHQTGRHNYFMNVKSLTPKINSEWTKNFRNASSLHIAKGVNQSSLRLTADVTQEDVDSLGKSNNNSNFTLKDYEENEDVNHHTENAVKLIEKYGTKDELKRMKEIEKNHMSRGHILHEEVDERHKLSGKYYNNLVRDSKS